MRNQIYSCCPDESIIAILGGFVNSFLCKNTKTGINYERTI